MQQRPVKQIIFLPKQNEKNVTQNYKPHKTGLTDCSMIALLLLSSMSDPIMCFACNFFDTNEKLLPGVVQFKLLKDASSSTFSLLQ